MLNLLFISDSPKAEYVKGALQPLLKVIIDVVTDFDHGLRDVFEKRPATVCIQDQIGGVTGESVARHIQMLLGNSAPTFILLHSGNGKARAIKGLYEHLVDLNQPNAALAEEIKNTLKSLLGDQWEKIYIPPKLSPAVVRASVSVPEESREDADKLVDDFLSDLETSGFSATDAQSPAKSAPDLLFGDKAVAPQSETPWELDNVTGTVESERAQAINDDLAELLLMEQEKIISDKKQAAVSSSANIKPELAPADASKPSAPPVTTQTVGVSGPSAPAQKEAVKILSEKPVVTAIEKKDTRNAAVQVTVPTASPAAEFRISHDTPADDHIPEDLFLAFEENYRSESLFMRRSVIIGIVCAVFVVGGWYFVKQRPQLINSLKQRLMPSSAAKRPPVALPAQKPVPPPVQQPVLTPPLPTFIPQDGHDSSFAVKNPGWERYVGKLNEFRIFSVSGRIQALQVLAVKDAPISESLLKSVMQEFVGKQEYRITSLSTKAGVRVEKGIIQDKGEIIIYRKNGALKAFVMSVN